MIGRARDELRPGLRSFPVREYLILYSHQPGVIRILRVLSGYRYLDAMF